MVGFLRGARLALPIVLGYLPVGFAYGVLAVQAGLSPAAACLMSVLVYAGSAQLIAAGLVAAGTGMVGVVATTFIVNLRHLLMSAALTPYLRSWSKPLQAWFGFQMTDETFAANLSQFCTVGVSTAGALGLNATAHAGWIAGSVLGVFFDSAIGDVKPLGLDFALPGMFIALLIPHLAIPRRLLAACSGACLSVSLALAGAGQWNVILATIAAATLAAFVPLPGVVSAQSDE